MNYSTIDGDISDFIDSMIEESDEFSTDELRTYLVGEGHSMADAINAIISWQSGRFEAMDPSWRRFKLTPAGFAAVEDLRAD